MKPRKPIRPRLVTKEDEARRLKEIEQMCVKGLEEELRAELSPIGSHLSMMFLSAYIKAKERGDSEEDASIDAYWAAKYAALHAIARATGIWVRRENDNLVYDSKKLKFDPHGIRYTHQIAAEIAHDICEVDIPAWNIDEHLQGLYQTAYLTAFCVFAAEGDATNARAVAVVESAKHMITIGIGQKSEEKRLPRRVRNIGWNTRGCYASLRRQITGHFLESGIDPKESRAMAENAIRIFLIKDAFDPDRYFWGLLEEEYGLFDYDFHYDMDYDYPDPGNAQKT